MPRRYPIELRACALSFLDSGKSRKEVCETFAISLKTLCNWIKRRKKTGDVGIKDRPKSRSHRKLTPEKLLAYINAHPDHYLKEIGKAFGVTGSAIFMRWKNLGFLVKKRPSIANATRKREKRL